MSNSQDHIDTDINQPFVIDVMKRGLECPFRGVVTSNPICLKEGCALYVKEHCCFYYMGADAADRYFSRK